MPEPLPETPKHRETAALFVYRQRFRLPGEQFESTRIGIMGLLDREHAKVLPHEETIPERVAAIRQSLSERSHDLGPLWLWCNDPDQSLERLMHPDGPPRLFATDRFGCIHEFWSLDCPGLIATVNGALNGRQLFLADGHHRYAAGWRFSVIQVRNDSLRSFAVGTGVAAGALQFSPPSVTQIEKDAAAGRLLPAKSTDFFPKLAAGLVIHRNS